MKNFSRFSILAAVLLALAGSAGAVDLSTNAQVDIIEGITITQTQALNFGVLVLNNGTVPVKHAVFGESYSMNGVPQRIQSVPPPSDEETAKHGVVATLDPLPRFEIGQPANVFRIFERGGRFRPEVGIPQEDEEPGRPRTRLSNRGLGTENRTDSAPVCSITRKAE